tara:strand:- start:544 stop:843 length:300 start_codon:yes stop_codon:yes gene_type:complete
MYFFIPYIEIKNNIKEQLYNIYGWTGSISVITAYGLTSFESDEYLLIDILNLYGSLAIGITCFKARVWQATVLEVAWFGVGTYSLVKNIIEEEGSNNCH